MSHIVVTSDLNSFEVTRLCLFRVVVTDDIKNSTFANIYAQCRKIFVTN